MAKTENEVLGEFLTIIENEWRAMHGIQERVRVIVSDKEPPTET